MKSMMRYNDWRRDPVRQGDNEWQLDERERGIKFIWDKQKWILVLEYELGSRQAS